MSEIIIVNGQDGEKARNLKNIHPDWEINQYNQYVNEEALQKEFGERMLLPQIIAYKKLEEALTDPEIGGQTGATVVANDVMHMCILSDGHIKMLGKPKTAEEALEMAAMISTAEKNIRISATALSEVGKQEIVTSAHFLEMPTLAGFSLDSFMSYVDKIGGWENVMKTSGAIALENLPLLTDTPGVLVSAINEDGELVREGKWVEITTNPLDLESQRLTDMVRGIDEGMLDYLSSKLNYNSVGGVNPSNSA